jgi:hypothetical protein
MAFCSWILPLASSAGSRMAPKPKMDNLSPFFGTFRYSICLNSFLELRFHFFSIPAFHVPYFVNGPSAQHYPGPK